MQVYDNPNPSQWPLLCQRPAVEMQQLQNTIATIFSEVENKGDEALYHFTEKFDGIQLNALVLDAKAIQNAGSTISEGLKTALQKAHANIVAFHEAQRTSTVCVTTQEGVVCWQKKYPIAKVGLYIPGGTAPLISTVLMLAIPATLAGCKEIVLCTPPKKDGSVDAAVCYAASLCGITKIYTLGGGQAIAAMALGTATVPKVDKIFGPGNQYVTAAKQYASIHHTAIDMPAGPSEVLIAVDATANPNFVAADLLSQAEHGADSQVILVTTAPEAIEAIQSALEAQLEKLARKKHAKAALDHSKIISFPSVEKAVAFINAYAPEHYIINVAKPQPYLEGLENAGSVFIGPYTPESAGDYASGTNHTLPTNGYAKQYSGVNLDSFLKAITFQEISKEGLEALAPTVMEMAVAEGLEGHKNAIAVRLNSTL